MSSEEARLRTTRWRDWKAVSSPIVDEDTGVAVLIQSLDLPKPKYRVLIGRVGIKGDFLASLPAYFISFEDYRIVKKYRAAVDRLMGEAEAEVERLAQNMRSAQ